MIKFRPYQRECIDAFYDYYNRGNQGHGLIVVPTAGGKSLIIAGLVTEICRQWHGQRIIILSHVRELIQQNHSKVLLCWNNAPAGVYSAALGLRESHLDIVTATVQSVYRIADQIGHRDLCFIDEAHLLQAGGMGMYGTFINELLKINPAMKICGFTATDYRLDRGSLTEGEGKLFDDVIIEIPIQRLLDEGYLTPPISKSSLVQADLEGVKKLGGEFNIKQMAARFDQREFINAALDSDLQYLQDRRSIALFCATLENAAHVAEAMLARGIACEVIDGEMKAEDREDKLERFRSGELRALASVGVITTGTDIPNMDCIVMFRATESPGLYQQIIGRGFRVMYADGYDLETIEGRLAAIKAGPKPNFLTLDHGGNIERHGAIINVQKPKKREKGQRARGEVAKARICEICRTGWPLEVVTCGICGHVMKVERDPTASLSIDSSNADILGTPFDRGEKAEWFDVDHVRYNVHAKKGEKNSVRVTYFCGLNEYNEWLHVEAPIGSMLNKKFVQWWGVRSMQDTPHTISQFFLKVTLDKAVTNPKRIMVAKNKNGYFEIIRHSFQEELNVDAKIHAVP
jgi:DNA repair protein RadD